jgi:hypothetical protein
MHASREISHRHRDFVTGNDFLVFKNVAKLALSDVLASATSATQASGASAISYLTQRRQILGKWCINVWA